MTYVKPTLDPLDTVASQYKNSPTLMQLIDNFRQYIDPSQNFEDFYNLVWNVDTAQGFGLDILGRIVGVSRQLNVPAIYPVLVAPGLRSLTDDQFRQLILAKALTNISGSSAADINAALRLLFAGRGNASVVDNLDMSIRYRFMFALGGVEFAIMAQSGAVPKPAAVSTTISTIQPYFGFSEPGSWSTFGEATFAAY